LLASGDVLAVEICSNRNQLVSFRSGSYQIGRQFDTFNEWYQQTIRAEYAERYGLTNE
jgi:hypothetical protein